MKSRMHVWLSLLIATWVACLATPAWAQGDLDAKREQARPMALEGFELFQAKKYNEAIAKLEEAERIFHAPTHLLFIGRARRALGDKLTAYNTFIDILIEDIPNYAPEQFQKAKADAQVEADSLRSEIATLTITISGVPMDRVTVSIDDNQVPARRLAHPVGVADGPHEVKAVTEDADPATQQVEAIAGASTEVALTLTPKVATVGPAKTEGEGSFPVLGTITLALGGAALVVGAITGVMTLSQAGDIKDLCDGVVCPENQREPADDAKLLGNVSTATFVIGGVLAATGIVLLIVDPFSDDGSTDDVSVGVRVGPTGAALVGSF